jgi:hypothetical protein
MHLVPASNSILSKVAIINLTYVGLGSDNNECYMVGSDIPCAPSVYAIFRDKWFHISHYCTYISYFTFQGLVIEFHAIFHLSQVNLGYFMIFHYFHKITVPGKLVGGKIIYICFALEGS